MNKRLTFLLFTFSFFCFTIQAQVCSSQRYIDSIFSVTTTQEPANYATVESVNCPLYFSQANTCTRDLSFDLYEPTGDVLTKRPLIIMSFGGAFLVGSKRQSELVAFCEEMASKGYVVASIDYRLGYSLTNSDTAIRAVYRGMQDFRAAVRYFRENAAMYKIDPDNVFGGGNSAGSINAIHATYLDEEERMPPSLLEATYFQANGILPDWDDLGCIDCSGNTFAQDGTPNAVINLWGAIGDTLWIEAGDEPIISFHGDDDNIVNSETDSPFGASAIFPSLSGSIDIHSHCTTIGNTSELHVFPGVGHEVWTDAARTQVIYDETTDFLYEIIKPAAPLLTGTLAACSPSSEMYCITNPNPTSSYCWEVNGGTILSNSNDCITVDWTNVGGIGTIDVNEMNCVEAIGDITSIVVGISASPVADFSFAYTDNVVDFTDLSTGGAIIYSWDFGDLPGQTGGNTSTMTNPSHLYTSNGTYTVNLTVSNAAGCTDVYTTTVVQNCQPNMTIAQNPTPSGIYQAEDWVRSSEVLQTSSNVTMTAEDCVELMSGFEVPLGAEFLGVTMPCNN